MHNVDMDPRREWQRLPVRKPAAGVFVRDRPGLALAVFCTALVGPVRLAGAESWSMIANACEEGLVNGIPDNSTRAGLLGATTWAFVTAFGWDAIGTRLLTCPVSVADGAVFNRIRLRYLDRAAGNNDVVALFMSQPVDPPDRYGLLTLYARVTSVDLPAGEPWYLPGTVTASFTAPPIDGATNTYFVLIMMRRDGPRNVIGALQVSLDLALAASVAGAAVQEPVECPRDSRPARSDVWNQEDDPCAILRRYCQPYEP